MSGGAIALVTVKAVLRIFFMEFIHKAVARDFCDDGGERYGRDFFVAFDNSLSH